MQIEGVAQNGKGGALLIREGEKPVYVDGLARWPEGTVGLAVVADGHVVNKRYVPVARADDEGAVSQGVGSTTGLDTVLQAPKWHLKGAGVGIEPGPWTIKFADGNGNLTKVRRAPFASTVHWTYDPVQPINSSSGVYSGGEAAEGTLDDVAVIELWERLRSLMAERNLRTRGRPLGTGRLTVSTVSDVTTVSLKTKPTSAFAAWWRDRR